MGKKRGHKKIDALPPEIIQAVNDAIVKERKTYKQIEEWLKSDGYDVSESSVQRYGQDFLARLEGISRSREQAKSIIETSAGMKLEMSEATSTVAFQLLMDMLINTNTEGKKLDRNALEAIRTLAALEKSTVSREKLRLEYDRGIKAAAEALKKGIAEELRKHPELTERLEEIIDGTAERLRTER